MPRGSPNSSPKGETGQSDLGPELQIYGAFTNMDGFKYGLQVGFPEPGIHGLEVLQEGLDQLRDPFPGIYALILFIEPPDQRLFALLNG